MQLREVLTILDSMAPFASAEQWDNVGLMVGDPCQEIHSILVALDPSFDVIQAAKESGADLIITHHPLIFTPIKRLSLDQGTSGKIVELIRSGISLVSMHTNLDIAKGGTADVLAGSLSLRDVTACGVLRLGKIAEETPLHAWAMSLPFDTVRVVDAGRPVKTVCACPGSGMEYFGQALEMGCDTFVTGDVRYHAALDAGEKGINVVDLGHFNSEQIAMAPLAERLCRELPGLSVRACGAKDVFKNIKGA